MAADGEEFIILMSDVYQVVKAKNNPQDASRAANQKHRRLNDYNDDDDDDNDDLLLPRQ